MVVLLYIMQSMGSFIGGDVIPYTVYLSSNVLFPLMTLFIWLKPEEYHNYVTLYMAGKIVAVVLFYVWAIFSTGEYSGAGLTASTATLLGANIVVNMADILSIWGAWKLKKKYRNTDPENGGL